MKILRTIVLTAAALCAVLAQGPSSAAEKLSVVTTTTYFADLVRKIGGDHVDVRHIAQPKFNVHFIQPRPSDVRQVRSADLYVSAGLDLEAWSDPLLEAAGRPELFRGGDRSLDLSQGVRLLQVPEGQLSRSMGDMHLFGNPHYQMDPRNLSVMARTVAEKLKAVDAAHAPDYDANLAAFEERLAEKTAEWSSICAGCRGRSILSYHNDIAYLADFLGLTVEGFFEPKPGIPPSPKHLASLESVVRERSVGAILMPAYYSRSGPDAMARRTGIRVAVVCQNPGEVEGTEDIFSFFDYNLRTIAEALDAAPAAAPGGA